MECERTTLPQPAVKIEEETEALIFDGAEIVDIHNVGLLSRNDVPSSSDKSDEQRRCLAALVYLKNTRSNNPGECSTAETNLSDVEPESTGYQEQPITDNRHAGIITHQLCGLRSGKSKTFAPSNSQMGRPVNYNEVRLKKRRLHTMVKPATVSRLSDDEDYEEYYDEESDAMPDNASDISDSSDNGGQQSSLMEILNYCQVIYSAIRRLDKKVEVIQRKVSDLHQGKTKYFAKQRQVLASLSNGYNQTLKRKLVLKSDAHERKKRIGCSNPADHTEPTYRSEPIIIQDEEDVADVIVNEKPNVSTSFHSTEQILENLMPTTSSAMPCLVPQSSEANTELHHPSQKLKSTTAAHKMNKPQTSQSQRSVLQQLEMKKTSQKEENAYQNIDLAADYINNLEALKQAPMPQHSSFDLSKNSFEFLGKQYPHHDLTEFGKDWKACISAINSLIGITRRRANTGSNQGREYLADEEESTATVSPSTSDSAVNGQLWWLHQNSTPLSSTPHQRPYEKLECLGRSDRKVELPASVIHLAKQRTRPELAARFLIRHLFPDSVLLRSNVYGAIRKGKAPLDCNKINAVREFLMDCFPSFDLAEDGKDWKVCVDAINGVIRCLRYELKKTPQGRSFLKHYSSPFKAQTGLE
ncbi:uncharacterized protein [Heptranchias perlo]|uniref:uncharacterized protein isoform X2 n=1 Tax=Heptranchias perlo TaxID=212740 RepID=UPI00355938C1